jgi:hypothetical protein
MAHVVAYIPDLLFGSRVQADLQGAGHTVELVADVGAIRAGLTGSDLLVVDLTAEATLRTELVEALTNEHMLENVRTLAFYSHVEADVRNRAEQARFDLLVPRSRMAREGAVLVARLLE